MELNLHGWAFEQFIPLSSKKALHQFSPIAGSYAVLTCKEQFLLCYNTWRKQWELPAGKKEENETSLECAKRELFEETGQRVSTLALIGVVKLIHIETKEIKYNPIYYSGVASLDPFQKNEETSAIKLWSPGSSLPSMDAVDFKIIEHIQLLKLKS
jgi:8-oxo-dGTP diphosphatase